MRFVSIAALAAALAAPLPAQAPVPAGAAQAGELPTIRVEVDVVNILCSVRDKHGRLIANLDKDDFRLFENNEEQEIKYFSRETDLPLTIGLLVDVSKSQERLLDVEKLAAHRFLSEVLRPTKDLAFVISFGVEAELLQDLTSSLDLLRDGLDALRLSAPVGGVLPSPVPTSNPKGTVLYDAIFLAAEDMLKNEVGRKVLVVISDGVDYGSEMSRAEAIEAAQRADVMVYSIYYADPRYQYLRDGFGVLKRISEETGGRIFRVSRKWPLERIFAEIQAEMRSQYSLGYTPTNSVRDGSFRRIRIKTVRKGLKVQARRGYYATPRS